MTWEEVIKKYPHQWVIIDVIKAKTKGKKRIIETMEAINGFGDDWDKVFEKYTELKTTNQKREYYICSTSNEVLDICVKSTRTERLKWNILCLKRGLQQIRKNHV